MSLQSGGPVRNVVVGIVCAVLVLIHLLVGLIAHKLDHLDSLRLSQVPLCGRPGMYHYRVLVKTGWKRRAGQARDNEDVEIRCEHKIRVVIFTVPKKDVILLGFHVICINLS